MDVEATLARLERESAARTAELKALAAELPAQLGRRALLRTFASDLRASLDVQAFVARSRWFVVRRGRAAWYHLLRAVRPQR